MYAGALCRAACTEPFNVVAKLDKASSRGVNIRVPSSAAAILVRIQACGINSPVHNPTPSQACASCDCPHTGHEDGTGSAPISAASEDSSPSSSSPTSSAGVDGDAASHCPHRPRLRRRLQAHGTLLEPDVPGHVQASSLHAESLVAPDDGAGYGPLDARDPPAHGSRSRATPFHDGSLRRSRGCLPAVHGAPSPAALRPGGYELPRDARRGPPSVLHGTELLAATADGHATLLPAGGPTARGGSSSSAGGSAS